jgi:hypothetical protein
LKSSGLSAGAFPNNNGNVRSQTIQPLGVTQAFSYDGLNRLYVASEGSNWTQTNVYATYGNRAVVVGGYVPNSALTPQVITEQSPVPYTNNRWDGATHDAAGNVTAVNGTSWADRSGVSQQHFQSRNTTPVPVSLLGWLYAAELDERMSTSALPGSSRIEDCLRCAFGGDSLSPPRTLGPFAPC